MYNEFENALVRGIHISRYIASWNNSGGSMKRSTMIISEDSHSGIYTYAIGGMYDFIDWLETLTIDGEKLSEEDIHRIVNFANNGKIELELSAKLFIGNLRRNEAKRLLKSLLED